MSYWKDRSEFPLMEEHLETNEIKPLDGYEDLHIFWLGGVTYEVGMLDDDGQIVDENGDYTGNSWWEVLQYAQFKQPQA